ncbi:hypothetical protein OHA02_17275 [Streptomyces phaeochromogenes]|nr:hypothetical protein [Streptomyces phaeochromogenes]
MSRAEDLPQGSGSAGGRLRHAEADAEFTPKQLTFRAYMEHSVGCADCDYGNVRCGVAREIWREWRALPQ